MKEQCRIFIGWDHRQPISYNVLQHSILIRASKPVAITPLVLPTLPIKRTGLTPFTFTRYLVPWLCDFDGWALFLDSDILVLGDVVELFSMINDDYAVMVAKNPKRFEWASAILWNCGHEANKELTPDYVADETKNPFKWGWLGGGDSSLIGEFPGEWNHLVGYDEPRSDAKLVHYTMGIPGYEETQMSEYADAWRMEHQAMNSAAPWSQLMGQSVHACHLPDGRVLPWLHPDVQNWQENEAGKEMPPAAVGA